MTRLIEQAKQITDGPPAAFGRAAGDQARGEAITPPSTAYRDWAPDDPGRHAAGQRAPTPGDTQGEAGDRAVAERRRPRSGSVPQDEATGYHAEREVTAHLSTDPAPPAPDGAVTGTPRRWLRLEAVTLLAGSLIAYSTTNQPWWLVPLILIVPDLVMVGYLGGTRFGASTYNLAHSTPLPAALAAVGWWQHDPLVLALGLVWLSHIGMDRALGYGLKYDDHFQHTHLGRLD